MRRIIIGICLCLILIVGASATKNVPLKASDMLACSKALTAAESSKQFAHKSLVYITPWNGQGYDVAKNFTQKFDYVAPVWHQILCTPSEQQPAATNKKKSLRITIGGGHDVDAQWMRDLRLRSPSVKIVPRFIWEGDRTCTMQLAGSEKLQQVVVGKILKEVTERKYDGVVLEMTEAWMLVQQANPKLRPRLNAFVNSLGSALHSSSSSPPPSSPSTSPSKSQPSRRRDLIIVARPPHPRATWFGHGDLRQTHEHIDGISLMTYDYSTGAEKPGPNAPADWARWSVEQLAGDLGPSVQAKILLGLNLYGMHFSSQEQSKAVLGRDLLETIAAHGSEVQPEWHDVWKEHSFRYETTQEGNRVAQHQIFYPTPQSLAVRLQLANELGVGLSLWEGGQGLPCLIALL